MRYATVKVKTQREIGQNAKKAIEPLPSIPYHSIPIIMGKVIFFQRKCGLLSILGSLLGNLNSLMLKFSFSNN